MLPNDLFVQLARSAPRRLGYRPEGLSDFEGWTRSVRERLGILLRSERWPERAESVAEEGVERETGFTRHRLRLEAGPLFSGEAYLLVPDAVRGRTPGVLCLHGHGGYMAGKDMVAAPRETHPIARECAEALNYGYGVQLARAGYVTLCPDAFNFGERVRAKHRWAEQHICDDYFTDLALYGYNLMGITVGTNRLWLDYLGGRPEVAPDRLGCVGLSYGGIQAVFTMAMEERLRAGVVSGALHSMKDQMAASGGGGVCGAQIVPGFLEWFDFDDLAISLAPRPVFYELMRRDGCFDFNRCSAIYEKVAGVYRSLGVPDRTGLDAPDTDHRYSGVEVPAFFGRFLRS
jgi:hypothetical protein